MSSQEFEVMAAEVLHEFSQTVCVRAQFACQPICQVCGLGKPVHITRWGTVLMACSGCIAKERARFDEYCLAQEALDDTEPDWWP